MNLLDAAYHTVHDYPGGAVALAARLGKHTSTLSHEVRPPAGSSAKLGLLDARKVMHFSYDYRILHALATDLGFMAVPLPQVVIEGDTSMQFVAELAREFSELMGAAADHLADGRITDTELGRLERGFGELVAAGERLLRHCKQVNAAAKPVDTAAALKAVA